jgi:hypothetical protein
MLTAPKQKFRRIVRTYVFAAWSSANWSHKKYADVDDTAADQEEGYVKSSTAQIVNQNVTSTTPSHTGTSLTQCWLLYGATYSIIDVIRTCGARMLLQQQLVLPTRV